ncbi:hypothetical protein [Microtetraspora malaysiensis]|uniref:hypothetical protein n=1 Tax=Microtetraspora malaysiensis TaxID=161358 RepID=UPI003D8BC3D2
MTVNRAGQRVIRSRASTWRSGRRFQGVPNQPESASRSAGAATSAGSSTVVTGEQDPPVTVAFGLPSLEGEARQPILTALAWRRARGSVPRGERGRLGLLLVGGLVFIPWGLYWGLLLP